MCAAQLISLSVNATFKLHHVLPAMKNVVLVCAFRYGLAPLSADYLQPSEDELRVELYQGSVTEKDARLRGFDLVTSIEL